MSDSAIIPCPSCSSLNRIPAARMDEAPRCGDCKAEVLPVSYTHLTLPTIYSV